jgi:hypothetical protein
LQAKQPGWECSDTGRRASDFDDEGRIESPAKLVVAQDINDGCRGKTFARPPASFGSKVDVARQDDDVRIGGRDFDRPEFQVQIAENMQAHE